MSFNALPYELYESIFNHVPSPDLQQTVLSVTRAIPDAPFPLHSLFRCIRLSRPEQAIRLYQRLRFRRGSDPNPDSPKVCAARAAFEETVGWVKELSIETWTVDAEIVINLVRLLPKLQSLSVWIGPNNFTPEHLERLFSEPVENLQHLSLRFRPYVEKATYYQFLKGAYFDSTLTALSLWPAHFMSVLSIVQDPHNQEKAQRQGFAQPLVFFRLDLVNLLTSPAISSSLKYLRLRIPSRPVARSLCAGNPSSFFDLDNCVRLPKLEFLDLSTCGVLEAEIDTILSRFATVKHIVLDGCSILRGDLHEGEATALGKRCALIGVFRARDREKMYKAWQESRAVAIAMGSDGAPAVDQGFNRRPKRGRKGLATATISFRTPDPIGVPGPSSSTPRRITPPRQETSTLEENPSQQENPIPSGKSKNKVQADRSKLVKIRILPALPSIATLSITLPPAIKAEQYPIIRADFEEGWREGIAQLAVTRARLRTSAGNGFRVMRILPADNEDSDDEDIERGSLEEGLYGLEDVDPDDPEAFGMSEGGLARLDTPTLCFVGPGRNGAHELNCGHSFGWEAMKDDM
ncbi:hypothetical protein BDN70DRAFT_11987 [Pholiota conissans]|uniref:F-box domain-containing protein n=1 Tax=Pholiota conissans TaxID=109636 RepID=A0A9P5ZFD7_9AGAR|nr:hypothetical protein BDN70DRAFT_11987 [Pholiota conissans]